MVAADGALASLPEHLSERVRALNEGPQGVDANGGFVVYWMHHALRSEENPALDTAKHLAAKLDRPLLVYAGLGGKHPHNNARHSWFILESLLDVQAALQSQGIAFHVHIPAQDGGGERSGSPLTGLLRRASIAVFEDFPAPPMPRWSEALAKGANCPVLAVDAGGVLPLKLGSAQSRAFAFRDKHKTELWQRAEAEWPVCDANPPGFSDANPAPLAPAVLSAEKLGDIIAALDIDHSVGRVAATRGGSIAAHQRWQDFLSEAIEHYAARRNDAAQPGAVSRMSAYLHYGCISPLRVARDAIKKGGKGPDKFLDELLIWRELSWHWCFHQRHRDLASLDILPEWARQSLDEFGLSEARYNDWQLEFAQTDDELWNSAQQSLLINGELHNNLRMTWGKCIAQWQPPAQALATLLRLNHRYALDGSDPNSYTGLLWCLGLLDRPFKPPQAPLGLVRGRSSRQHAERLNIEEYRQTLRDLAPTRKSIAIVGGGVSGLSTGHALQQAGHEVTVFDKARGPGGRLSNTSLYRGDQRIKVDQGAPAFCLRQNASMVSLQRMLASGSLQQWQPHLPEQLTDGATAVYCGTPRMSALSRLLAEPMQFRAEQRIVKVSARDGAWTLLNADDKVFDGFDVLIIALPSAQAAPLLGSKPEWQSLAGSARYQPCWVATALFEKPLTENAPELAADILRGNDGVLDFAVNNGSKPGERAESWTLYSTAEWAEAHIEMDAQAAAERLLKALKALSEPLQTTATTPLSLRAHRWRYARPSLSLAPKQRFDAALSLGVCGDWSYPMEHSDGGVEAALLSGHALASAALAAWAENRAQD